MRRLIYILLLLNITILFTGCRGNNTKPILYKEDQTRSEQLSQDNNINFTIDKISFSRSFQNIKPQVEVVKKGLDSKILASFGLMDSSGIQIEKIVRDGKIINIYVNNESSRLTNKLVVPQALIDLRDQNLGNLDDYSFYIHNNNYETINLKLDANDAINIVNSDYQIATSSLPNIDIEKRLSKYYWNLEYLNAFDKTFKDSPIINLSIRVDADTGEVVKEERENISSYIDHGIVLDFVPDQYILYKKVDASSQESSETLWLYDVQSQDKKSLFTSDDQISSAYFNQNSNFLAFLEAREKNNHLYIISLGDQKTYKVDFENLTKPTIISWKDNDSLYIVHKDQEDSFISTYDIHKDQSELLAQSDKNILDLDNYKDYFLILEEGKDGNDIICLNKDLKNSIFNDNGSHGRFINDHQLAYIKNDSKKNVNYLYIYDLVEERLLAPIEVNISSYSILSDDILALVAKNEKDSNYTLYEYDLINLETISTVSISSDKFSLNQYKDALYINASLPFDELEGQIIYSMDISNLIKSQP